MRQVFLNLKFTVIPLKWFVIGLTSVCICYGIITLFTAFSAVDFRGYLFVGNELREAFQETSRPFFTNTQTSTTPKHVNKESRNRYGRNNSSLFDSYVRIGPFQIEDVLLHSENFKLQVDTEKMIRPVTLRKKDMKFSHFQPTSFHIQ